MPVRTPLAVDVVSDVVCPWCYIGKRNLAAAIALVPEIDVTATWRPFQLDPDMPAAGMPRDEHIRRKFGDPSRLEDSHRRLVEAGRPAGIAYAFDRIRTSPNTLDAHVLVHRARHRGPALEDAVVEALFRAYFVDGRDLTDRAVLLAAANEAVGAGAEPLTLDGAEEDTAAVRAEIDTARRMGINGVPCFIIGNRYAISGAQPATVLADTMRKAAAEQKVAV